jgi:predicted metal-binding membrane protein
MAAASRRSVVLPVLGGLVAFSWLALWSWSRSPYGRYLEHGDWLDAGPAAFLCRVVPGGEVIVPAALHVLGWLLMTSAMMLPTVMPLVDRFSRLTCARNDHLRLLSLLLTGYLAVWAVFGVVAHALDSAILELVRRVSVLAVNGWAIGAFVIALAGLFQFSALKYRCLDRCRSPLSFITQHWRGRDERRRAFLLGAHHGLFCVGCCWALMLLMFVVGTGSIAWMLVLGTVMAIEKNMPWGRRLSTPLGIVLLACSAAIAADHLFASAP